MKKAEQIAVNRNVEVTLNAIKANLRTHKVVECCRLRCCQAWVLECNGYLLLKSYNTIIAAIDPCGVCYDFLRFVYGYTTTSAQHISKFFYEFFQPNRRPLYMARGLTTAHHKHNSVVLARVVDKPQL